MYVYSFDPRFYGNESSCHIPLGGVVTCECSRKFRAHQCSCQIFNNLDNFSTNEKFHVFWNFYPIFWNTLIKTLKHGIYGM